MADMEECENPYQAPENQNAAAASPVRWRKVGRTGLSIAVGSVLAFPLFLILAFAVQRLQLLIVPVAAVLAVATFVGASIWLVSIAVAVVQRRFH
jgi:hypothetical protein